MARPAIFVDQHTEIATAVTKIGVMLFVITGLAHVIAKWHLSFTEFAFAGGFVFTVTRVAEVFCEFTFVSAFFALALSVLFVPASIAQTVAENVRLSALSTCSFVSFALIACTATSVV